MVPPSADAPETVRRHRSWWRRGWRVCWISVSLMVGLAVWFFIHLSQVGLPEFIKRPILAELRLKGITLDFSRLRWHWRRGIIAENVNLLRPGEQAGEQLFARELRVELDSDSFWKRKIQVSGLRWEGGTVVIPLVSSNSLPAIFRGEEISAQIRFDGNRSWVVQQLIARWHGIELNAQGIVAHPTRLLGTRRTTPNDRWRAVLGKVETQLNRVSWSGQPVVKLTFHIDGQNLTNSTGRLETDIDQLRYRDWEADHLRADIQLRPHPSTNDFLQLGVEMKVDQIRWKSNVLSQVGLRALVDQRPMQSGPERMEIQWTASRFEGASWIVEQPRADSVHHCVRSNLNSHSIRELFWKSRAHVYSDRVIGLSHRVERIQAELTASHFLEAISEFGCEINVGSVQGPWGNLKELALKQGGESSQPIEFRRIQSELKNVRTTIPEFLVEWTSRHECKLGSGQVRDSMWKQAQLRGSWKWPQWEIEPLGLETAQGRVDLEARLDGRTRRMVGELTSTADPHLALPWLTPKPYRWLKQFGWPAPSPPSVSGVGQIILPQWPTNGNWKSIDWRGEVLPTLKLAGRFQGVSPRFREVPGDAMDGEFTYTNRVWYLPKMTIHRPEGDLILGYRGSELTRDYWFGIDSKIDPRILQPLLDTEAARKAVAEWEIATNRSPHVVGEVLGRWEERERIQFQGKVVANDFSFRGEPFQSLVAHATGGLQRIELTRVQVEHALGAGTADRVMVDVTNHTVHFTNARSRVPVDKMAHLIGPRTEKMMKPYIFEGSPEVELNGMLPTKIGGKPDARFEIKAEGFSWQKLRGQKTSGVIVARGDSLEITNLVSRIHGGDVQGDIAIDLSPHEGSRYGFSATFTNVDLASWLKEFSFKTNRLEGRLSGVLHIDSAVSWNTNQFQGHGWATLEDGFLWDLPLFGVFSKPFDTVVPGLGQSRFNSGSGHFVITNSVIHSSNLEFRSPTMRLQYAGSVDLQGRLNATMMSELLRDTPVLGPLVTMALAPFSKLFEYKVSGSLNRPEIEPLYVPKVLLAPLQPFKTLKDLLSNDDKGSVGGKSEPPANRP